MPGDSKRSRAYKLYLKKKKHWKKEMRRNERIAKLKDELRHPCRQDITDDPLAMGHTTGTSETYMPTSSEEGSTDESGAEEDFIPSTQVLERYMSHSDKENEQDQHAGAKQGSSSTSKQVQEDTPDNPQPSTSGTGAANKAERFDVNVAQDPEDNSGKTRFALPINIQIPVTVRGQDSDGVESLTNAMGQEMENDYSSDPGWEDGPDDYEHLPEPDLNNAEVESEVDSADEWGNPDDEGIDMATPIDLDFYPDPVVNYKAKDFVQETTRLNMNRSQKVGMWAYNKRHHPELAEDMKSYDTLERRVRRHLPMPTVSWKVQHVETRKYYSSSGTKFPEKLYGNRDKYDVLIVWARIDVKDLIRFHAGLHSDSCSFVVNGRIDYSQVHLTFTIDGVPLAKSSPDNLHLMAVRFKGCRMVYILQARVAKKAAGKDVHDFLDSFVGECARLQVHVDYFLADAPMRSFAKVMKGHAGRYSCEVCEAAGVCLKRRICYPSSQASKRHRTRERWLECVADLNEQRSGGNNADVRGIMGESPLLKLPHSFDIVKHCPTDPMHRDWLGLMKSTLWRRTVAISKTGHVSVRGQRIVSMVSDHYKSVQLPSEVSHRSRPIDYPNFKAHEWKALLVTSFHVICDAARREVSHRLARVWAKFAFLSFLYYGPGDVQGTFTDPYLTELHNQLYMDFEQEFGEEACSYNVHTYCHMPVVRKLGRPSAVSTEPFEAAYGFAQVSFAPGTRNISLQICRNMLLRNLAHEQRMGHCQRRLTIERESPSVRCDDSILIDEFLNYYKVIETTRREVQVARIRTVPWTSPDEPDLPFYQVGVCVLDFIEDTTVTRPREWFKGKGVHLADNVLVPFFWDMLFS